MCVGICVGVDGRVGTHGAEAAKADAKGFDDLVKDGLPKGLLNVMRDGGGVVIEDKVGVAKAEATERLTWRR